MNKKLIALSTLTVLLILPLVAVGFDPSITPEPNKAGAINFVGLISTVVDLLWLIFVAAVIILVVITGILFLTAQGEPEKIKKARMALIFSIIGIIVALLGYRIVATVGTLI